jgi:hypothetical protein
MPAARKRSRPGRAVAVTVKSYSIRLILNS